MNTHRELQSNLQLKLSTRYTNFVVFCVMACRRERVREQQQARLSIIIQHKHIYLIVSCIYKDKKENCTLYIEKYIDILQLHKLSLNT